MLAMNVVCSGVMEMILRRHDEALTDQLALKILQAPMLLEVQESSLVCVCCENVKVNWRYSGFDAFKEVVGRDVVCLAH